jgi:hypothetical protein
VRPTQFLNDMNKDQHLIVIKYVMANPKSSLKNIVLSTGFSSLALHRFLTDYELIKPRKIFDWVDTPLRKIDKNGKVIGGHEYLFSIRSGFDLDNFLAPKPVEKIALPAPKKVIKRDPITAALFGAIA